MQGFLPFVPPTVTHNDLVAYTVKRNGKVTASIRKSKRLKAAEDMMRPYVQRLAAAWCCPIKGAVVETLKVCWPCEGKHADGEPRTDPPDLDNWEKTFNDLCEQAGIISCDAHIVAKHSYKLWSETPGVFVRFEEIG